MGARAMTARQVADNYGFTPRHWIRQAVRGKIPGAYQPSGPGGHWLFDASQFATWIASRKPKVEEWPGYTKEVRRGGRERSVMEKSTAEASKQQVEQLLRSVLGSGSRTSKRLAGETSPAGRSPRP